MELTLEQFRSIIFYNFRRGLSQECIDELKFLIGDKAPSYSTVKNWLNAFTRGRLSLKAKVREGHPKMAIVPENIDAVRELIMQDRHVTYRQRHPWAFLSPAYIQYCMNTWKKICSRWMDPAQFDNRSKKFHVDCKEMLK